MSFKTNNLFGETWLKFFLSCRKLGQDIRSGNIKKTPHHSHSPTIAERPLQMYDNICVRIG